MRLLIVGNHTCGNRGDSAILRGLVDAIKKNDSTIEIDMISRYPISSRFLFGCFFLNDNLYDYRNKGSKGLYNKIKKKLFPNLNYQLLLSHASDKGYMKYLSLPSIFIEQINSLKDYDAIIQVGGSFFVDLYGEAQFEHALCAVLANKPIYMVGHSVGPFRKKTFNKIANYVFDKVNLLILREKVSLELMRESSISEKKVIMGVDTAWLVDINKNSKINLSYALNYWTSVVSKQRCIAITLRELAPFDLRLGITQEQYEDAFYHLINALVVEGYEVLIVSTCTGIDSYHKDDRMIALNIKNRLVDYKQVHIVMDELNDTELGLLLSKCILTIGTRLHSAIISMNYGTPAIAINYEHKSLGIMQQLELPMLAVDVSELISGNIIPKVFKLLSDIVTLKALIDKSVSKERELGNEIICRMIDDIKGNR